MERAVTLSAEDKTYAVLVKFPDEYILSGDQELGIFGSELGDVYGKDHAGFYKNDVSGTPFIWWRGGGASYTTQAFEHFDDSLIDGRWHWMVFRKDFSGDMMHIDWDDLSLSQSRSVTRKTTVTTLGYTAIGGGPQAESKLQISRFYEWDSVLTDSEVSGIIRQNNIPQTYSNGYLLEDGIDTECAEIGGGNAFTVITPHGEFWSKRIKIAEPRGKPWMYADIESTVTLAQSGAFATSGLYDVFITTRDYTGGLLTLNCGLDEIGRVAGNGSYRFTYLKEDSTTSGINLNLYGSAVLNNITIDKVNVTKMENEAMAFDYIERIDGVYKYQNIPRHKSNLFSIRIKNSNLNDSYFGGDKATIQKSINNIIRKIIKQITPIHTQLFNITWTED